MPWTFREEPFVPQGGIEGPSSIFTAEVRELPPLLQALEGAGAATLFVREFVQNSMDARDELEEEGRDHDGCLDLEFEFDEVELQSPTAAALGIPELLERFGGIDDPDIGLSEHHCLNGNPGRIRILRVHERRTTGMYGPWVKDPTQPKLRRKMFSALLHFGKSDKSNDLAGGSFGFGKGAIAAGSRCRVVAAYTCFAPRPETGGMTRRLFGVAYWGSHDIGAQRFEGWGYLGQDYPGSDIPVTLDNEDADQAAVAMGLAARDPSQVADLGTSFLILDPDFGPEDIIKALQLFWWPALVAGRLTVSIRDQGLQTGELVPRPRACPELLPFIEAHQVLVTGAALPDPDRYRIPRLSRWNDMDVGALALVIDESGGWSWREGNDPSIVALIRGTGMVNQYMPAGRRLPRVRGVFLASEEANPMLRRVENKAHDLWEWREHVEVGLLEDRRLSASIKRRIERLVGEFSKEVRPEEEAERRPLRVFSSFFKARRGVMPPPPPDPSRDPWSIQQALRVVDTGEPGFVKQAGKVFVSLDGAYEGSPIDVLVRLEFLAREDGDNSGSDLLGLDTEVPDGWARHEGEGATFVGTLASDRVEFPIETTAYPAEWLCGVRVTVEPDGGINA